MKIKRILTIFLVALLTVQVAEACTSMLVSAKASATGRPLMWKHRDTGTEDNFIERVPAKDGRYGYVALYNAGDRDLKEAWMGMNDVGFAVMNTHSYNVQPDTARFADQEGVVMSKALAECRTVDDFQHLLDSLPKPMGVTANFGVMDADGNLAYFETNDHTYVRCDVEDNPGYLIRTNFSVNGIEGKGMGYVRYGNVCDVLGEELTAGTLSPMSFTEKMSRSFWNSQYKKDFLAAGGRYVPGDDFVPRYSSSASLVIEGVNPGESAEDMCMYTLLGYPPCSELKIVTLYNVPDELRPTARGYHSPYCDTIVARKHKAFTKRGNTRYIDMNYLKPMMGRCHEASMETYKNYK